MTDFDALTEQLEDNIHLIVADGLGSDDPHYRQTMVELLDAHAWLERCLAAKAKVDVWFLLQGSTAVIWPWDDPEDEDPA